MVVKPPIKWIGSPNFGYPSQGVRGRSGEKPLAIVLHIMEGTLGGCDQWFPSGAAGVSAHFGISQAGVIHQYVREEDAAWGNGIIQSPSWSLLNQKRFINPNLYTISIEHEGVHNQTAWSEAMLQADIALISYLCDRWAIPIDREHIIGHNRIDGVSRANCPGNKCPWDRILSGVQAALQPVQQQDIDTTSGQTAADVIGVLTMYKASAIYALTAMNGLVTPQAQQARAIVVKLARLTIGQNASRTALLRVAQAVESDMQKVEGLLAISAADPDGKVATFVVDVFRKARGGVWLVNADGTPAG